MTLSKQKPHHSELPPAYSESEMQEMIKHGERVARLCKGILLHK